MYHNLYDEGYLVAERRWRGENLTRFTTKKAVWFAEGNTPPAFVCWAWSMAGALIAFNCLQGPGGGT